MLKTFDTTRIMPENKGFTLPQAIVDYLFDFNGPKFLFDDIYHFSIRHYMRHANNRNMLPVVKFMLTTLINHTYQQNSGLLFIPEAITNGQLYYEMALKHEKRIREVRGHLTTYRMGEILNKDELSALTEKNKNRAMARLEGFQKIYPNMMAVSPTGMEAMLKCLSSEPGFSNYQMLRDEDFEAFWIGVCFAATKGGFAGEVADSRNGNFETFALFQVLYGLVPFRSGADMDIVFPNKKNVTPHDYLQMLFSHLLDVVPKGFKSDLSVKMAMRMLMLEDMRTKGIAHPTWGKLNFERMNPLLRESSSSHDKSFEKLSSNFLSFMKEYNLGHDLDDIYGLKGYDVLREYYEEKSVDIPASSGFSGFKEKIQQRNSKNLDIAAVLEKKKSSLSENFQIPYQLDGDFFSTGPVIFDDKSFSKLSYVEQIALRTIMGIFETAKSPLKEKTKERGRICLLIDRRGGKAAKDYSSNLGVDIAFEARGITSAFESANFEELVKVANIEKSKHYSNIINSNNPHSCHTNLEDIENDCDNFMRNRAAFVAPGTGRISSQGKCSLVQEIVRRQARLVVFDYDWENSSLLTNSRLYCRKIQLGLVERPIHLPRHFLSIATISEEGNGHLSKSLSDDLEILYSYAKNLQDTKVDVMPRYVTKALLETLMMVRMYYSEEANARANPHNENGLIDWQSVSLECKAGLESNTANILDLCRKTKNLLLEYGMASLSIDDTLNEIERIDPDFKSAIQNLEAIENIGKARSPRSGSYQKIRGFNAA